MFKGFLYFYSHYLQKNNELLRYYKALTDENYSVAEDLAKYYLELEEKMKYIAHNQEIIRNEIITVSDKTPKIIEPEMKIDKKSLRIDEIIEEKRENFSERMIEKPFKVNFENKKFMSQKLPKLHKKD